MRGGHELGSGKESPSNVRRGLLRPAVEKASAALVEHGRDRLPDRLTPHSLRHTFASLLVALGEDPGYVMDQMGHTDPSFTLRVYRKAMKRRDGERDLLRALVGAEVTTLADVDRTAGTGNERAITASRRPRRRRANAPPERRSPL